MNFDKQLLFFFSALGAFNSVLLGVYYLFFAKPKHRSNYLLSGLLAALGVRIWKSVFYYFNRDLAKIFLQIGLSACFFIGPFLYLYVRSRLELDQSKKALGKYLLIGNLLVVLGVGYMYPYQEYIPLWKGFMYKTIYYQWLGFVLLAGWQLRWTFKKVFVERVKLSRNEVWAVSVFTGVFVVWLGYFMAAFTSYIVGALSFSFVLYLTFMVLFFRGKEGKKDTVKKEKYANQKIEEKEADRILAQLEILMNEKQIYKDPNLQLSDLAKELMITPHTLSQFLNDNLNKSFSQYINENRVKEAIRLLDEEKHLKITVIAENCGFNSNSTFYTAFKKVTNTTPAQYSQRA